MALSLPLLAMAAIGLPTIPTGVLPVRAPDFQFSRPMQAGQTLAIRNIDGNVTVRRATGREAVVSVTRHVIRGNGELVQALLDTSGRDGITVCTVYLREVGEQRSGCNGSSSSDRRREPLDVEMIYDVQLPAGVDLNVTSVDGDVVVSGHSAQVDLTTVDGDIRVEGRAPEKANTVDGDIEIRADGPLPEQLRYGTVDGSVLLTLPDGAGFALEATTVDGTLESDFALTARGRWGPRAMRGTVGDGRTRIRINTVDGNVVLRRH